MTRIAEPPISLMNAPNDLPARADPTEATAANATGGCTRLRVRVATDADRPAIYELRHAVYARELRQHAVDPAGRLVDALDEFNDYLIAEADGRMVGCISITPPAGRCTGSTAGEHRYSIDKYVQRAALPVAFDDSLFEVRLLTVAEPFRGFEGSKAALLLMYAALRWIESRGGRHVIGIGRHEVMSLYEKVGLVPLGITVQSGAVTFHVMHATVESLRRLLSRHADRIRRLCDGVDWQLDAPLEPAPGCFHGGAFFDAIGDTFEQLDRRRHVINADVLDAWFDPSPAVLRALEAHLPWLLRTSPPTGCDGLVRTIASVRGVEPANVLPGAGSSDLIYLAMRQWLTPASRVLILDPTYGEYAHVLEQVIRCRVDRFPLSRREHYDVDLPRLGARLARGYDLVVLVNPNSPTGRHVDRDALMRVLSAAPATTRCWIDETYVDYVGASQSLERFAASSTNVVVCKSMSKVFALSGARAAYLCGPAAIIDELRPLNPPWAVSLPAQVAAVTALKDGRYYARQYRRTHQLRQALAGALADQCGFDVLPGVANFLLCHLAPDGSDASNLVDACRRRGLFIRDAANMGRSIGRRCVRIAVKDAATNHHMLAILRGALNELEPKQKGAPTGAALS